MDKRMSQEVDGACLGTEFRGYIFRITGGNDKEGFAMKQGVLTTNRVRLLLDHTSGHYRPGRTGERKRRSVRGCIVAGDLVVVSLVVVRQGEEHIPGLTDATQPRRLGPKRASNIRKLFNLSREDDVRQYVIKREVTPKNPEKKPYFKAPKIQRLVTPLRLQRKRAVLSKKIAKCQASREAAAAYAELLAVRQKEQREKRNVLIEKRRSSMRQ
jgi:small subunit ribosomal protein S6e